MTDQRRSFDEHVRLFADYAARVSHLTPESWDRLRVRCANLSDSSFRSLMSRARLAATPHALWLPETPAPNGSLELIAGVSRFVQTSIAVASEVAAEFSASASGDSPYVRPRSTGKAITDAYVDANFLIESAVAPIQQSAPGVVTAVRAAGQAVLRHDWLSPAVFEAAYRLMEPEIPFAVLEARSP